MSKEQKIQKDICLLIKSHGGLPIIQTQFGVYGSKGVPDILFCLGGIFGAFEVKRPGESPQMIQEEYIKAIQKAGGYAAVVESVEEGEKHIQKIKERL